MLDRPKWFYKGSNLLIAYAGDLRAAQTAEIAPRFRRRHGHEAEQAYVQGVVVEAVRHAHKAYEAAKKDADFAFLVAYNGKLYTIQEDYSVVRSHYGYAAIGAGQYLALGALAALDEALPPRERLERALKAAARHATTVCRPFHHVNVGPR